MDDQTNRGRVTIRSTKVKDWPESERPRERLAHHGPAALSTAQLLAILLRTGSGERGVMDLALGLLDRFKTLRAIDEATITELSAIKGIGPAKIAQLKAALELGKRLLAEQNTNAVCFSSAQAVFAYCAPRLQGLRKECFRALLLDAKNRMIREVSVSEGTLTNSLIHPREAFREAIRESAAAVIFIHNHPSGDPSPSRDDLAVTERLKQTGDLLGIPVLDHVIVGNGTYTSLKEKGLL
jgi:DNA repair protein RadC